MSRVYAGWLNVLGQFATTGTLGYITVKHLGVMWLLANGHIFSNAETFLGYASKQPECPCHACRGASCQVHHADAEGHWCIHSGGLALRACTLHEREPHCGQENVVHSG